MNREIKFRMWSSESNKYFYDPQVFECLMQQHRHDNDLEGISYDHVGDGQFVANKQAIPLLQSLNDLGIRTRTHHIDDTEHGFFSILLDDRIRFEIREVLEKDADRTKYNGRTELLISW